MKKKGSDISGYLKPKAKAPHPTSVRLDESDLAALENLVKDLENVNRAGVLKAALQEGLAVLQARLNASFDPRI